MESQRGTFSCPCCYEPYETEYRLFPSDGGVDLYQDLCDRCESLYYDDYDAFNKLSEESMKKQKLKIRNNKIKRILDNKN